MAEQDGEQSCSLQREPGSEAQEKGPEPLYFLQRHTASDENLSPGCTFQRFHHLPTVLQSRPSLYHMDISSGDT